MTGETCSAKAKGAPDSLDSWSWLSCKVADTSTSPKIKRWAISPARVSRGFCADSFLMKSRVFSSPHAPAAKRPQ